MDFPTQLALVRLLKFASILAYAGGVGVGLGGTHVRVKKRAVHLLASPALVAIWLSGYVLSLHQRVSLGEAWLVGGFVTSFVAQLLLTRAARDPSVPRRTLVAVIACLGATLAFMVFKPTWGSLLP